jgi:hypothetical protein
MKLGSNGWGILIGWVVWLFIVPAILEYVEAKSGARPNGKHCKHSNNKLVRVNLLLLGNIYSVTDSRVEKKKENVIT